MEKASQRGVLRLVPTPKYRAIKSRILSWTEYVARMRENTRVFKVLRRKRLGRSRIYERTILEYI